jgi:hypothetical protein
VSVFSVHPPAFVSSQFSICPRRSDKGKIKNMDNQKFKFISS